MGDAEFGQKGIGRVAVKKQLTPVLVMKDDQIKMVVCGLRHTLLLKKNGDIFVSKL